MRQRFCTLARMGETLKMLKGYYPCANHCFISRSTGDLEHYPVGHLRVCRSLQHACEPERQAEQ